MTTVRSRVAVITGAGREQGLGAAIARALGQRGCVVVLTDLGEPRPLMEQHRIGTTEDLERLRARLVDEGIDAHARALDVTDEAQVDATVEAIAGDFGGLDFLVNNAGIGYLIAPLAETPLAAWQAVIAVNLTGAFLCSRAAARVLIRQGRGGRIVNVASQAAKSGFPHMAAYVASKHGLVGLTRTTAIELGPYGITANAVCPNHVTTGLGAEQNRYFANYFGQTVPDYLDTMRRSIPLRREGYASDTAEAVAWLCSPAAAYITGEALNVSGGCEMH